MGIMFQISTKQIKNPLPMPPRISNEKEKKVAKQKKKTSPKSREQKLPGVGGGPPSLRLFFSA
jgi:hypothetical protein